MLYKTICFAIDKKSNLINLDSRWICERWDSYWLVYIEGKFGRAGNMISVEEFKVKFKTINQIREEKLKTILNEI
jgi:hypothetical protein